MQYKKFTIKFKEPFMDMGEVISHDYVVCRDESEVNKIVVDCYYDNEYTITNVEELELFETETNKNEVTVNELDFL